MTAVIDTDSFQVRDTSAKKIYLCTVGSEGFTPPELLGKDFHKVKQSQNQDRFRLAVLIHYLLFGYHPFSGSWTGVGECPEQTELIKQGYWYGGYNSPIRENDNTISLDVVHPKLKQLFLQCFNNGHEQSHLRPTAKDWHEALENAVNNLTACNQINNHHYSKHYGRCYWCDRASNLCVDIFPDIIGTDKIFYETEQYYSSNQNELNIILSSHKIINLKTNSTPQNIKGFKTKVMRAIEVTGTVNNKGQFFLDKPLTVNKFTRVRVIVLLSDADSDVAQAIANCGKARNKEVAYSKMCCAT